MTNVDLKEGGIENTFLAGFSAGISCNTITNPIWMVKTRIQLMVDQSASQRAYTGYSDVVSTIFKDERIGGFCRGIFASYWGCTEGAIQFIIYEQLKKKTLVEQNKRNEDLGLPPTTKHIQLSLFCTAAIAKSVAAVYT